MFNPNPAMPWFSPTGTTSRDPRGTLPSDTPLAGQPSGGRRPRFYATQGGPVTLPDDWSDEDARQWVQAYDQHIATLTQQWQQTAGYQGREQELRRRQIEAQIEDAKKARQNAMEIAQLQSETSRYGMDLNRQTAIEDRLERQRQFDLNHGINTARLGLDTAEAYTRFAQTPDMLFVERDFRDALDRVGQGGSPQMLRERQDRPQPKSWEQFSVLKNYGPNAAGSGSTAGPATVSGGGSSGGGGGGTDARITAANAVMRALPPSGSEGHDTQNWAALDAIERLYFAGDPNAVDRLGPSRRKIAEAGLRRKGYDVGVVNEDLDRIRVGQGSALSA